MTPSIFISPHINSLKSQFHIVTPLRSLRISQKHDNSAFQNQDEITDSFPGCPVTASGAYNNKCPPHLPASPTPATINGRSEVLCLQEFLLLTPTSAVAKVVALSRNSRTGWEGRNPRWMWWLRRFWIIFTPEINYACYKSTPFGFLLISVLIIF